MSQGTPSLPSNPPWVAPESQDALATDRLLPWSRRGPGPMLRGMVLLVAVTLLVVSGGLATWLVYSMRQAALEEALPMRTQALEQISRNLAFRVEQQQRPLLALAALMAEHIEDSREVQEALLTQATSMARLYEKVQLADGKGQLLLNLSAARAQPLQALPEPVRDVLRRGLLEGKPLVQAWIHSEEAGSLLELQHVVAIRDKQGALLGVLGGSSKVSAQTLLPFEADASGKAARLFLYAKDGRLLAHSTRTRWQLGIPENGVTEDIDPAWLTAAQSGAVSERNGTQLWSAVPLPWTQWVLVQISDAKEWAPHLGKTEYLMIALVLVAVAVMLGLLLSLMAHPLTDLYRRADRALGRGVVDVADPQVRGANWWQRLSEHDWGEARTLRTAIQALGQGQEGHKERELQLQMQLQTLMDYAPVGLVVTHGELVQRVGMQAARVLGYTPKELQGMPIRRLCTSTQSYEELMNRVSRDLDLYGQFDSETCLLRKDKSPVWVRIHGQSMQRLRRSWEAPRRDSNDDFLVWEVEDVTTQRLMREQSSWKAMHDTLTHLPNRAAFALRLKDWLLESAAMPRESVSLDLADNETETVIAPEGRAGVVLYLDLDHFAQVNRQGGRQAGDEVLAHIARLIEASVRPQGWVARVGGDEFAVLLPGFSQEQGMRVAQLLCMAVQDWEGSYEGQRYMLGASIGLLALDSRLHTVASALKAVDMACYAAKRKGRNRVEVMTVST